MDYKEIDLEGEETLKAIAQADKFNHWMYETIKPYCSGKILEIGSGIGNISSFFVKEKFDITLSDIRAQYRDYLRQHDATKNANVIELDIVADDFNSKYNAYLGSFQTVFALNVVEHVEQDKLAIQNLLSLLTPGGKLIILVPAYQFLFNNFDRELYHFRRYNRNSLNKIMQQDNSQILKTFYFNLAGIAGWFLVGSVLKKKIIPSGDMKLYNKLVPIFKLVDKLFFNQMGLSVISVAQKNN